MSLFFLYFTGMGGGHGPSIPLSYIIYPGFSQEEVIGCLLTVFLVPQILSDQKHSGGGRVKEQRGFLMENMVICLKQEFRVVVFLNQWSLIQLLKF